MSEISQVHHHHDLSTPSVYPDPAAVASKVHIQPLTDQAIAHSPAGSPWTVLGREWVQAELQPIIAAAVLHKDDAYSTNEQMNRLTQAVRELAQCRMAQRNLSEAHAEAAALDTINVAEMEQIDALQSALDAVGEKVRECKARCIDLLHTVGEESERARESATRQFSPQLISNIERALKRCHAASLIVQSRAQVYLVTCRYSPPAAPPHVRIPDRLPGARCAPQLHAV